MNPIPQLARPVLTPIAPLAALVAAAAVVTVAAAADEGPGSPAGLSSFLPAGISHDGSIPTPASVLGHEVGERHARPDQIVLYLRTLAERSPRVAVSSYGRTHELRDLVIATVTSPENHAHLEEIRTRHLAALVPGGGGTAGGDAGEETDGDRPVIVWMGYSVHGNEASGANAALLLAYHLAAARGEEVEELLRRAVILIDPCINPDGLGRFSTWVNGNRSRHAVTDPMTREHREPWPGGRTNHYWFDLNRDWLLLTQPESRGRLEVFHRWRPNVLTDFHEMGSDSTYFFQPGVPSRQNPNTPAANLELTREIARYHARALDAIGSLYFTEERFDDFYYGKGSTYPDVNGSIGILFEQASARGHARQTRAGVLTFPFAIRNHLRTSLSTLEAAVAMRKRLLEYQVGFYRSAAAEAAADPVRAYVVGSGGDRARLFHLADILRRHRIRLARLGRTLLSGGEEFTPEDSIIVSVHQPQYRLVKALFERRTEFADETFYDVSAWTLPLSFGLPSVELTTEEFDADLAGAPIERVEPPRGRIVAAGGEDAGADAHSSARPYAPYAYVFDWAPYQAPRAAWRLLDAGVRLRVATRPFEVRAAGEDGGERDRRSFGYGAIVVPAGTQEIGREKLGRLLRAAADEDGIEITAVASGLTAGGIDLGSPSILPLERPRPLLVTGPGVSAYEAGEVWHLLDERFGIGLSLIDVGDLAAAARDGLDRYTHIVLVSGSYSRVGDAEVEAIQRWVRRGGVVIAIGSGLLWVERRIMGRGGEDAGENGGRRDGGPEREAARAPAAAPPPAREPQPYADYERLRARNLISGAIFEAAVDITHPLAFGYRRGTLPLFRRSTIVMRPEADPFATPLRYTAEPLLSGYASARNVEAIAGSAAVCATRMGSGTIVRIVDDPNFRGVWYGTSKLFLNALFFGRLVKATGAVD